MSYLVRVFGAASQLANVVILNGDPNESISGRSHRAGWIMAERAIDALVFWERRHCELSHRQDVKRAHEWAKRYPI